MESLSPALVLIQYVKRAIECSGSIRAALFEYHNHEKDDLSQEVKNILTAFDQGLVLDDYIYKLKSPYRKAVIEVVLQGLKGVSIYQQIVDLEKEIIQACNDEINKKLSELPFLILCPLLLLQLPAFLILLFGTLLEVFLWQF